jgi:hypothetical protein
MHKLWRILVVGLKTTSLSVYREVCTGSEQVDLDYFMMHK